MNEATQSDFVVGLATTDTTLIASNPDDLVAFEKHDGDANIDFVTRTNGAETATDTGVDVVNNTAVVLEFYWDGDDTVYAYVNGVQKAAHTANLCQDEELTPSIAFLTGEALSHTMTVDWVRCIQFN